MPKLSQDGYFIGGECDKIHRARAARERGGGIAIGWLLDIGAIRHRGGGWYRFTKRPTKKEAATGWREKEKIAGDGTEARIGFYRVVQEMAELFRNENKAFRMSFLKQCVLDMASFEFGMRSSKGPFGPFQAGFLKPHHDALYQKRKRRGDFGG